MLAMTHAGYVAAGWIATFGLIGGYAVAVIRRGRSVGTADPRTVSSRQLAEMMVGSELPSP